MQSINNISDLPKDTSCLRLLDLPKNPEHSWFLDLPEEIINEIILLVPPIDLFRVSKVSQLFKKLAYKRRKIIINLLEYEVAARKGDILSLLSCPLTYWNFVLYDACSGGHMDMVQFMISKGAIDWNNGLYGACLGGHMFIIQLMISKAECLPAVTQNIAQIECLKSQNNFRHHKKSFFGHNEWNQGLAHGCRGGHMDIVQYMIEKGANNWNSGLINACHGGHMDIVQLMIEKGANNWNSGLINACKEGHLAGQEAKNAKHFLDIVQLMINRGATECYCGDSLENHH